MSVSLRFLTLPLIHIRVLSMRAMMFMPVVVVLFGCVSPYKQEGFGGGFSETQLDTSVFRVSFRGNGVTQAERVEELALLRSAELTLKNGFTHFAVIDSKSREIHSSYNSPTQSYTTANATAYGNSAYGTATTTTYGGQTVHITKPSTTNTIMCFKGKPDIQGLVYDAQFICNSIGQKHSVVCNASGQSAGHSSVNEGTVDPKPSADVAKVDLNLPEGWERKPLTQSMVNGGGSVYASHNAMDTAVLLSVAYRKGVTDLMAYAISRRAAMEKKLLNAQSTEITRLDINGRQAFRFEVAGYVQGGVKLTYLYTIIEGTEQFAVVNAWAKSINYTQRKESLEELASKLTGLS